MLIHQESLNHYVNWIREKKHFAFAGYSDAEWYSILGAGKWGSKTALGQIIDRRHGERLFDIIKRRHLDRQFMFAIPKVLWGMPGFAEGQIDWFLGNNGILMEGWERDLATDYAARDAELYPLIRIIKPHELNVCMIGNKHLRGIDFLNVGKFVEISTPNFHMEPGGIEQAVAEAHKWGCSKDNVLYLVSAGVSAAVIIDMLYEQPHRPAWFMDCGSMWDAFVGIGGQREWRAKLYEDPVAHAKWIKDNIHSKDGRGW